MKHSIGGTGLLMIAILFIILFSCFLSASANYSKAFKVKNEIINIIEHNKGIGGTGTSNNSTLEEIFDYMTKVGYRSTGTCPGNSIGYNMNSLGSTYKNPMICIEEVKFSKNNTPEVPDSVYYKVRVFYQMDIPVINKLFHFHIDGTSKQILYPYR